MGKNLFWSMLAATAIMTGCSNEEIMDSQAQATLSGEEVPVNFAINMGGDISTYATESASGGWSNYKVDADMQAAYNHRAIIQVFTQSGDQAKPISEERVVIDATPQNDEIAISNLRLPAGHSYTAVVWVDFVTAGTSSTAEPNDLFYNTENLREVKIISDNNNAAKLTLPNSPEGRDAYTGTITFTVNADGTYNFDGNNDIDKGTVIPVTAKRPFGKVRLVLTDWDNKAQWAQYYAGQTKVMNQLEMTVKDHMAQAFNALTGTPIYKGSEGAFTFGRAWDNGDFVSSASAAINGVNWIEVANGEIVANHKPVTGVANGLYPILDFNYFIPINNDDAASYKLGIKTYGDDEQGAQQLISERNLSSIPVKKNCLTTIWGNFLTAGYNFTVTVNDEFDQFSQTVVKDDGTSTDIVHQWGNATARVERDETGKVTEVEVDAKGNSVAFDAAQWEKVMYEIKHLGDISTADVLIHASALPATADFAVPNATALTVGSVTIELEGELAQATAFTNSTSPLTIENEVAQTKAISVSATSTVEIAGAANYNAVTVGASTATFTATGTIAGAVNVVATTANFNGAATYDSTVTTTATSNFNEGTFNELVTANGTYATINDGTFNKNFDSNVSAAINGGSLNKAQNSGTSDYTYALNMKGSTSHTLTVNVASFGPLYAEGYRVHSAVYASQDILNSYSGLAHGNFTSSVAP